NATTRVTVSGPAGAHGMVRILPGGRVAARLDGRRLTAHLPATGIVAAARAAALAARARGYVAGPTSLRGSRR
ncbi:MAG: hypothetical protein QOJ82_1251, partial [Solirubrobacteraceae bacterium]|nr:hypothetical protein [Solirubrobacteraceae bacterium]